MDRKPKLSIDEQIEHLKDKGVTFEIVDEDYARSYLRNNNNYFKLTSYRKNYDKHPSGELEGKYIRLDFAYLIDMAIIDMRLRYQMVQMALDIEHHVKLSLMQLVDESDEDGYKIVQDYLTSLNEKQLNICKSEISRNKENVYCGDVIAKYDPDYPVWVFLELIPFGRLIDFYRFCADRFNDKKMQSNYYTLLRCKEIRNASAHSNCILNDLRPNSAVRNTDWEISRELSKIKGTSSNFRNLKMSNARIQQIVTLLYMHKKMVKSQAMHESTSLALKELVARMESNSDYYKNNAKIESSLNFLKLVIDSWFKIA